MNSPPFDTSAATAAAGKIPSYMWRDLPSWFVYGAIDVGTSYLHTYAQSMGWQSTAAMAVINGISDSAKFSYFSAAGLQPIGGKPGAAVPGQ